MRKMYAMILLLLCAILMPSCGQKSKPEDTIRKFETAFNNYDIEKMIECYEPSAQQMLNGTMGMEMSFGALGIDLKSLAMLSGGLINLYGEDQGIVTPKLKIIINDKEELSDDKVRINVTARYEYDEKEKELLSAAPIEDQTGDVILLYIDKEWYLSADSNLLPY